MPILPIPINEGLVKAVDEVGLTTHGAAMQDVYVDELGNVNRRPGLVEVCDFSSANPVRGLHWWTNRNVAVAVVGTAVKIIYNSSGSVYTATGDLMDGSGALGDFVRRVKFADFGDTIYMSERGVIKKLSYSAPDYIVSDVADADAPTDVTHVAFLDRYLIASEFGTALFHWSDVNEPDTWTGNFAEAEAQPDKLQGLEVENGEIYLFGANSTEVWVNDGSTPFSRLSQGYIQNGTLAAYSPAFCQSENTFCWLDRTKQVVKLNERITVPLSLTINKYLSTFTTVQDATGDYVVIAGRPYYILSFPTENASIVYDFTSAQWYEWGYWVSGSASYERFRGNSYCFAYPWGYTLVGDRANGKVYRFDVSTYQDNGETLRSMVRTGHINRDTETKRKYCNGLYFRLKRTSSVSDDGTPDLMVKYRDNGRTEWTSEKSVTLHQVSNTEFRGKLTRLGGYYNRQWEFALSDAYPLCMVSIEEDFDYEV